MSALLDLLVGPLALSAADWLALFGRFALLSLLAVGGAISTAPEMQRFVVDQRGWLDASQFTASVALAQAAPGPNVLFVAVVGYQVGGLAGVAATMAGTLLPSTLLTVWATRAGARRSQSRPLRAFSAGMAPLTIGLLVATAWVLLQPVRPGWAPALLVAASLWVMLRTRWSPLWPVLVGGIAGVAGLV